MVVHNHNIVEILIITFLVSFLLTFIVKKIAISIGAMDKPDARKVHSVPTPRLGGLAIFFAFLVGYMFYGTLSIQMISLLIGGFIIIITGIIDDIAGVPAKYKFLCQAAAACVVVYYGGLYFLDISFMGIMIKFPLWIGQIVTVIFITAIINAINLIDGLNGLCSGNSIIYFTTITVLGFLIGKTSGLDIIISVIMIGSII